MKEEEMRRRSSGILKESTFTTILVALVMALIAVSVGSMRSPSAAYADGVKYYLECPQTWVREGGTVKVYVVRHSGHVRSVDSDVNRGRIEAFPQGIVDIVQQDSGSSEASKRESGSRTKYILKSKEDTVLEPDEVVNIGFVAGGDVLDANNPDWDNQCQITVIDDDLRIAGIQTVSTPSIGDTYGLGETIEYVVDFDHDVEVRGDVVMGLWIGGKWRGATYRYGSGSDGLEFGYDVQPDDDDGDGFKVHDGYVEEDGTRHGIGGSGAVVEPGSGARVSPWYEGIDDQSSHMVNGRQAPRLIWHYLGEPHDGETF